MERQKPPLEGDERSLAHGWLRFNRTTLALKIEALNDEQLRSQPIHGSSNSLLGLVSAHDQYGAHPHPVV